MTWRSPLLILAVTYALIAVAGCSPQQPFYLHEDGDLSHYIGMATQIDYADVDSDSIGDVEGATRPFSLENATPREMWDLTLEEAVRCSLANSKVMKSIGGQVLGPPDFIVRNPELVPTVYDPAIVESDARTGVEAALAAFDTQLNTQVFWEKNDAPRNVKPSSPVTAIFPTVNEQDIGSFQARLAKTAATGGTWSLTHNVAYEWNNQSFRQYASDWNVNLEAEFRQPLLQGNGVQFNRIAGPGAVPGFYNGVMIARLNTDIALGDFEMGVRNLVSDVEIAYWELYFAYRNLDAVVAGRDSALQTWRKVYTLYTHGARGGEAEKEAQAREQYFLFRSAVEEALHALYNTEAKLRYMMGLAATDGRLIRPADEPTTAGVAFDWQESLAEGLCRSPELRQEKWEVKSRELELIAAKNFLLPRCDAVGRYRWVGLGDELIQSHGGSDNPALFNSNAYQVMTGGKYQEWHLGLEFNMPIGFHKEHAGVRNAQLALARERARLQEQELELSHQLSHAVRELEAQYVLSRTNFNRRVAAQRQVDAVAAAYEAETVTLDLLLDAQRRLAQAESDFYRSLVDYNKAISQVHYRKGSLLEYNGVQLSEGPWPGKAYFDAHGRARARDAGYYLDYGFTRPKVVSRGPVNQNAGGAAFPEEQMEPMPEQTAPELIPAPQPIEAPAEPPAAAAPVAQPPAAEAPVAPPLGPQASAGGASSTIRVKSPSRQLTNEPVANSPAPEADRTASGWRARVQR